VAGDAVDKAAVDAAVDVPLDAAGREREKEGERTSGAAPWAQARPPASRSAAAAAEFTGNDMGFLLAKN
jgi:hypothetical protein